MFLSQQIESVRRRTWLGVVDSYKTTVWRVAFDAAADRLVWKPHGDFGPYDQIRFARAAIKKYRPNIPVMRTPAGNKPVTGAEAMKLVGLTHPMAALDLLREKVTADPDNKRLENWVEPPKPKPERPKKAPPRPSEVAMDEAQAASDKAAEYERKVARYSRLAKKWSIKAAHARTRALKLQESEPDTLGEKVS